MDYLSRLDEERIPGRGSTLPRPGMQRYGSTGAFMGASMGPKDVTYSPSGGAPQVKSEFADERGQRISTNRSVPVPPVTKPATSGPAPLELSQEAWAERQARSTGAGMSQGPKGDVRYLLNENGQPMRQDIRTGNMSQLSNISTIPMRRDAGGRAIIGGDTGFSQVKAAIDRGDVSASEGLDIYRQHNMPEKYQQQQMRQAALANPQSYQAYMQNQTQREGQAERMELGKAQLRSMDDYRDAMAQNAQMKAVLDHQADSVKAVRQEKLDKNNFQKDTADFVYKMAGDDKELASMVLQGLASKAKDVHGMTGVGPDELTPVHLQAMWPTIQKNYDAYRKDKLGGGTGIASYFDFDLEGTDKTPAYLFTDLPQMTAR